MPIGKDEPTISVQFKMRQSDVLDIARALGYTGGENDATAIVAFLKTWVANVVGERTLNYRNQIISRTAAESVMAYQQEVMSQAPKAIAPEIE